jgi:hypothetical protein
MGNHNEAPALVACPNGDLLAIYYSAPVRYGEYYPHIPFIATRLRYGAEQWDMPEVIYHQADIVGASSLLWREGDKLWMFFGGVGLHRAPFRWTTSSDNGATWAPVQLPRVKGLLGTYSPQPITTMVRDGRGTLYLSCDGHFRPATWSNSLLWATDENGKLHYQVVYDRGRKIGMETLHRRDGSIVWTWNHEPAGLSTWTGWWSNGKKKFESTWRGVRCHGTARRWDQTGRLTSEVEFADGHPVSP